MTPNTDFDLYRVPEDHDALREAVRAVAENKIAPYAAEVDRTASFPQAAYDALVASDFHAPHVPEEYGGVGADAVASAIVVEEVARVCASSSLIPGANKLGSTPLILAGSEELKQKYLRPLAEGATTFSYALSEREAGSDTASMRTRATADGDDWVLNGQKSWITNAGFSEYYTVLAVTDPDGRRGSNVSAFVVEKSDAGFSFGEKERKMGIKGSPTRELLLRQRAHPRRPHDRPARRGPEDRACAPWTTPGSPSARRRSASPRARWTSRSTTSRSASSSASGSPTSRASSSCSPTWP